VSPSFRSNSILLELPTLGPFLAYQVEAFGEIEPSMQINFGGSSDEEAMRTLALFADRVMPKFSRPA